MKKILKILLLLFPILTFSQNKEESEIFKKIIVYVIEKNKTTISIKCEKPKTSFNIREFKEDTKGVPISETILNELNKNKTDATEIWDLELIKLSEFDSKYVKNKNCITETDSENIFKDIHKRENIISISKPLFDNNFENCIVSVVHSKSFQSASGRSYFLKKVNGIWVVITEFGFWIS